MASGHHRRLHQRIRRTRKAAVVGAATITAAALTAGLVPLPTEEMLNPEVELTAAVKVFPEPDKIPDLTGGLGSAGYDLSQSIAAAILEAITNNINLMALARAAGMDPESLLKNLPPNLLLGVLDTAQVNLLPILTEMLGLDLADGLLLPVLQTLGITDGAGITTVSKLLSLLGIDLSDPLNLSDLDVPGLNLITAGPPFTLLKLLGFDLGWVPGLPNSVAAEVNNTEYLPIGVNGLLTTVLDRLRLLEGENPLLDLGGILGPKGLLDLGGIVDLGGLVDLLDSVVQTIPESLDVVDLRVPIVIGFGMGAFAAGAAYPQIVEDLKYQPGGEKSPTAADDPLLGSLTILPMLLLRNPGRANGGLFARAYPFARLFGIDTVTPDTEVTHSGGIPILNTGLALGGANLIPVKVDATVQYDLFSDFAAWPNPFSIANNLMGFLLPTYILRGVDLSNLTPQLEAQLKQILGSLGADPLALNLYLTLPANSLPLLEPLYLLTDLTNLMTLGAFPNPLGALANALAPALTSLVNLGYTDVQRMPDGTYIRTLDQAGDPTAFMSFPDVDWGKVPADIFNLMVQGIQKEFFSGNPTPGTPNAITGVFKLLSTILGGGGLNLGGISDVINAMVGGLNPLAAPAAREAPPVAAAALPSATATSTTVAATSSPSGTAAPVLIEEGRTTRATEAEEEPAEVKPTGPRAAGPSAAPGKPTSPAGSVLGGVTNTVGGVTGGVTGTVGGVTSGVTGTVGGVTGGVAGAVGGLTGAVSGVLGGLGKKPSDSGGSASANDAA
ncbi:PE-PPE domain-containing protein [Mycolicibacterium rutilum]|uniref:PE-PPE domain-containing protein n=1 Tax=Mycolicibacterium rutilum TaxID=370526 RepID=A0A1H6IX79_MYCRU|nr:PE-PPE domain-containing protein [Mycolicibacterium rutilum]SEH51152.1 PE-PPE domain-containing protein [Mycolicibacterium rutilum]